MFNQLSDRFHSVIDKLKGRANLSESNIEEAVREIRLNLLEGDVNFKVVKEFCNRVKEKALGEEVRKSLTPHQQFIKIFHEELVHLMGAPTEIDLKHKPPVVIMMVGLQGSGKTTSSAKLAYYFKNKLKRFPYLVPADIYRPAAIEQLKTLASKMDIPVYDTSPKQNPIKIAKDALKEAKNHGYDTVILDTAGRLQIDKDMMKELSKIKGKIDPQHILLVVDAMTGQESVNVADAFHDLLDISGVVLTKMDGDARGGAALSVRYVTGKPIYFAGVGESYDQLEAFDPDRIARRILGMGDVLGIIEQAEKHLDMEEAKASAEKMLKNQFTLEDFGAQLKQMKKMGSMGKLMGMIPGMNKMSSQLEGVDLDKELKVKEAIISSMTKKERRNVKIINGSRRKRIALGSGTQVTQVNRLLKEFEQMQKMMKKFKKMGMMKGLKGILGGKGGGALPF